MKNQMAKVTQAFNEQSILGRVDRCTRSELEVCRSGTTTPTTPVPLGATVAVGRGPPSVLVRVCHAVDHFGQPRPTSALRMRIAIHSLYTIIYL